MKDADYLTELHLLWWAETFCTAFLMLKKTNRKENLMPNLFLWSYLSSLIKYTVLEDRGFWLHFIKPNLCIISKIYFFLKRCFIQDNAMPQGQNNNNKKKGFLRQTKFNIMNFLIGSLNRVITRGKKLLLCLYRHLFF